MSPLAGSPNVLFAARVLAVGVPSPGFRRLVLGGPELSRFAPHGRDQRIKLLVPTEVGYPASLASGLPEREWRARLRELPADTRPVPRSYTPVAVRPGRGEVELDVFCHARPGPASAWAAAARPGDAVLLSGPDVRRGNPDHGVQWDPGPATEVLITGDETALPAVRGILAALPPHHRGRVLVELGDPADAVGLAGTHPGVTVEICRRPGRSLLDAVTDWVETHGAAAARLGDRFYAWNATESTRVARVRSLLHEAGVAPDRVHAQGYWHDRPRPTAR